jgi:hypothetical protein
MLDSSISIYLFGYLLYIFYISSISHARRNLNEKVETREESERIKGMSKAVAQQARSPPPAPPPTPTHNTPTAF